MDACRVPGVIVAGNIITQLLQPEDANNAGMIIRVHLWIEIEKVCAIHGGITRCLWQTVQTAGKWFFCVYAVIIRY